MNVINEEIRVIQMYMAHLEKAIALAVDTSEKLKLKHKYAELEQLLNEKLGQCEDYRG